MRIGRRRPFITQPYAMQNKIKSCKELKRLAVFFKKNRKKIVFTNGCFDILHAGHIKLLEKAKSMGDILIVAVNTDASVKKLKGPDRPINKLAARAKVLAALEAVEYVTWFSEDDPANIIKEIRPDILVKGGDWKKGQIIGKEFVESYGGKVVTIPCLRGYSTKSLIKSIKQK